MGRTAPTASGEAAPRADRWRSSLILTLTRRCDLRCAYCPTVKEDAPELSVRDAHRALDLFLERYGGGDVKLFGGEPLLRWGVVSSVLDRVARAPELRLFLSTNGTHLDDAVLSALLANPKVFVTVSIDGDRADHDGLRRPLDRGVSSYDAVRRWLPQLLALPRFVVTQTIAPGKAARAADNFRHLRSLGVRRFNLLPGYYLPWREDQLAALERAFADIGADFEAAWAAGDRLYLRNLFTRAPTPFYNTGLVVDSDGRIHASNLVLAEAAGDRTVCGTLDAPPDPAALAAAAARIPTLLAEVYPAHVLASTRAVDDGLTRLCRSLYPAYLRMRSGGGRGGSPPATPPHLLSDAP